MNQEAQEIYIRDLIFYCLKKWRILIVFMILCAVFLGIYKYKAEIKNNEIKQQQNIEKLKTESESDIEIELEELIDPISSGIKYAIVGMILGAFLVCFIWMLFFLYGDTLYNTRDFKNKFGMPLLGTVRKIERKKGLFGNIDTWLLQLEEGPYAKVPYEEQIRIAAANVEAAVSDKLDRCTEKKKNIMIAGTLNENDILTEYSSLIAETEDVIFSAYKQLIFQATALREIKDYDGILFIEKRGASCSELIRHEREMVFDRKVQVLGCIVF